MIHRGDDQMGFFENFRKKFFKSDTEKRRDELLEEFNKDNIDLKNDEGKKGKAKGIDLETYK